MKALNISVPVTISRSGLDLTIRAGNYAKTLVNLKKHFHLSDVQAGILCMWLDDNHIEMVVEPKREDEDEGTTINLDRLVQSGWVKYPDEDKA